MEYSVEPNAEEEGDPTGQPEGGEDRPCSMAMMDCRVTDAVGEFGLGHLATGEAQRAGGVRDGVDGERCRQRLRAAHCGVVEDHSPMVPGA